MTGFIISDKLGRYICRDGHEQFSPVPLERCCHGRCDLPLTKVTPTGRPCKVAA